VSVIVSSPAKTERAIAWDNWLEAVRRWWPATLLTAVLGFLVLYPVTMLFVNSFRTDAGAFSIAAYQKVFSTPSTYEMIWTTVWLAIVRVGIATAIGLFLAWVVTRTDTPGRGVLEVLVWIKFFAPPLPMIVAWTLIAGKSGVLNAGLQQLGLITEPLFNIYSYAGIIWVSCMSLAAFIFLLTVPAFRAMDASLEESARMSGASRLQALRLVTIPVAMPTVLGAVFLAFIVILESFETEIILGVPAKIYVLSTRIFTYSQEYPQDLPSATALGSFFLLMVGVLIATQVFMLRGKSFVTISGRGYSQQPTSLGRWRWVTFAIVVLYFFIAAVLPLTMLVVGSFMKAWGVWTANGFTLNHWAISLGDPRLVSAITNTVLLGVMVGGIGTFVCALAGYVLVRTQFAGRPLLEFITWAPRVAPGVVLAIAFAWAYIGLPIFRPISGTLGMMGILLVVSFLPFGSRIVNGSMYQVSNELEEAARTSGAGWFTTVTRVLLPLLAPALLTSFILLFLAAIRNLVLVVFFYTPNSRVLSVILWEGWNGQAPERALVAGLLMMALSLMALAAAFILRKRTGIAAAI
jgi:iron(III) transport system permease protein